MLTKEILCAYLPYDVKGVLQPQTEIVNLTGFFEDKFGLHEVGINYSGAYAMSRLKLLLRPPSSLTKPITYNGETFVFTELFEIGDDGGFIYDFGNGNTKLINNLESIAKYNCYHDINYLPYPVVKLMYEYHFDVHGLIESGHAIELKEIE